MSATISPGDGSSGAARQVLVPSADFQQTGTVDWTSLSKSTLTESLAIFQRYSACGVDPLTVVVARALCGNFRMAAIGQKRLEDALQRLQCFGSVGKVLWFGFGAQHFIRSFSVTEEGATCLALAASLMSCYDETVAAEILAEMAKLNKAPKELSPANHQWKALLQACAGVLHSTTFATIAERFMSLHPDRWSSREPGSLGVACSSPASMANALHGLGKISRGEMVSMTIMGGADAGWLAALANWLFDLTVNIYTPEGEVLHIGTYREPQVNIIYDSRRHAVRASTQLQCTRNTYRLPDGTHFIYAHLDYPAERCVAYVGGRLSWDTALSKAFAPNFDKLLGMPERFGKALGNAARVYRAAAHAEEDVPTFWRGAFTIYNSAGYGQGFLQNLLFWFPELDSLRDHMNDGFRLTFQEAKAQFRENLSALSDECACRACPQYEQFAQQEHCFVMLVRTVIHLGQCLATFKVDKSLHPTRWGLDELYRRTKARFEGELDTVEPVFTQSRNEDPPDLGIGDCWDFQLFPSESSMHDAVIMFDARCGTKARLANAVAYSRNGLCVFLSLLQQPSDDDEDISQVTVVPGRIEMNGRAYSMVVDMGRKDTVEPEGLGLCPCGDIRFGARTSYTDLSMIVTDRFEKLEVTFEITGPELPAIRVPPAQLRLFLLRSRSLVSCSNKQCDIVVPGLLESNDLGQEEVETGQGRAHIVRGDRLMRWAAVANFSASQRLCGVRRHAFFLIDRECLQCCLAQYLQPGFQVFFCGGDGFEIHDDASRQEVQAIILQAPGIRNSD
ncbi:MAG: hypothetical protein M1817_006377 [Caeruleum heppii]|nr:MAG: hypothetical protein M1817_006377 [Caeruleum heppii]